MPTSLPPPAGLYPAATQQHGFRAGVHYLPGNDGRLAVCLHICEGGYQSSIDYLRKIGLSANFVISEGGSVAQLVNVNDSAQAQGLRYCRTSADLDAGWAWQGMGWYSPRGKLVQPPWTLLRPGMNTNRTIISIEHAGYHNKPRPTVQLHATINLLRWLGAQFPTLLPYVPGSTLIGHRDLDTLDRANCPGPYFDFAAIAATANTQGGRYRVKALPVYQRQELDGPLAGELPSGTQIDIDMLYANGAGHLASGLGFVRMEDVEAL